MRFDGVGDEVPETGVKNNEILHISPYLYYLCTHEKNVFVKLMSRAKLV